MCPRRCPRGQGRPRGLHLCHLVHSSAYSSLKSAKSVFFFLFAFWSTYQQTNGGAIAPPLPPGYATVLAL